MSLLIGFLTFILVLNCLFLILLVLVQLPKKEAGAGVAFGGGATDALFGAGSGNALTKITKYTATSFLALALVLTVLNAQRHNSATSNIQDALSRRAASAPAVAPAVAPVNQQQPLTPATNAPAALTVASNAPVQLQTPAATVPATNAK